MNAPLPEAVRKALEFRTFLLPDTQRTFVS